MKRLLAAMRVREPGRRLAAAIVQRVSEERLGAGTFTIGDWAFSLPSMRAPATAFAPALGFSLGLAVFGLLVWARPATSIPGAQSGRHSLEFELADIAREEPAPHVGELTNGLMREAAPRPASYEPGFPDNLPDSPLAARQYSRDRKPYGARTLFR
jgi:hypothetical protein